MELRFRRDVRSSKAPNTKHQRIIGQVPNPHWRSYSPLLTRFSTVNPAFLASVIESGFSRVGELNVEINLRTGFLHAGHWARGVAPKGRRKVNLPPQARHSPSHS